MNSEKVPPTFLFLNRKDAKIAKPTHRTEETADHADKRRWSHAILEHVARSRPSSDDDREPLSRAITPNASVRRGGPIQRPALSKSAHLATPHPLSMDGWRNTSKKEKGQAEPTRPRRVVRWETRLRRTPAFGADGFLTGGRRSSDRRSVPPSIRGTAFSGHRRPLCVLCVFSVKNRTGGRCRLAR
jgi:hypothetical protein